VKTIAWTIAAAVTFTIGLNVRPEPATIIETVVVTETIKTRNPITDVVIDILTRDVNPPETDEHQLYACFTRLVDDEDWHATIRYIERKWAGDACQALDHWLEHGWY
jgi:hypothetical protein